MGGYRSRIQSCSLTPHPLTPPSSLSPLTHSPLTPPSHHSPTHPSLLPLTTHPLTPHSSLSPLTHSPLTPPSHLDLLPQRHKVLHVPGSRHSMLLHLCLGPQLLSHAIVERTSSLLQYTSTTILWKVCFVGANFHGQKITHIHDCI